MIYFKPQNEFIYKWEDLPVMPQFQQEMELIHHIIAPIPLVSQPSIQIKAIQYDVIQKLDNKEFIHYTFSLK